jgi:ribosomal protein S18 acetylase RimI-like enzyme
MTPAQIINNNFHYHSTFLQSQTEGMNVVVRPGVTYAVSGLPTDTFNIIYVTDHTQLQEQDVYEAVEYYTSRQFPFCLWINQENLTTRVQSLLQQAGLHEDASEPGMILDLPGFEHFPRTGDTRKISDRSALHGFAQVVSLNWEPPDENVLRFYERVASTLLEGETQIEYYGSYVEGQLVSVLEMFPDTANNVGIYSVCTLAAFRGRGLATDLMKHALQQFRSAGYSTATLQASDDGVNIYRKLGFVEATRFFEYKSHPSASLRMSIAE